MCWLKSAHARWCCWSDIAFHIVLLCVLWTKSVDIGMETIIWCGLVQFVSQIKVLSKREGYVAAALTYSRPRLKLWKLSFCCDVSRSRHKSSGLRPLLIRSCCWQYIVLLRNVTKCSVCKQKRQLYTKNAATRLCRSHCFVCRLFTLLTVTALHTASCTGSLSCPPEPPHITIKSLLVVIDVDVLTAVSTCSLMLLVRHSVSYCAVMCSLN